MGSARRTASLAPAAPRIGSLPTLAFVLSVIGAALAGVVLFIHHRMAASQGTYTSFCDISAQVSCDVVLGSTYARLLGLPVAGWGLAAFVVAAALSLALASTRGEALLRAALCLGVVATGIFAISVYFFVVSALAIGVACPLCLSLDAAAIALFATSLAIVRALRASAPAGWPPAQLVAVAGALVVLGVASVAAIQWPRDDSSGEISVDEVRERDPRFYAYYVSQPVVEGFAEGGGYDIGPKTAPITIVEFTDFECPFCARAYRDLKRALAAGLPDVRIVVRNFPLSSDCNPQMQTQVHARACQAAVAGECAGAQGKFTEYEDLLFANQDALDTPSLIGYAARLGLDQGEFERCLASPAATAAVAEDVAAAAAAGVASTPTFFVNGRRIAGGFQRPEHYRYAVAIERALRAAKGDKAAPSAPGAH